MPYYRKLNEDIQSRKKFYPNISDEKFMDLIRLDPTYKGGNTAGTYAKWILGLANQNKLTNIGHVTDALRRFEQNKNQLIDKDIMRYHSIEELDAVLNDDNSYKDLSHRQEVRGRQKDRKNADLSSEADLIYEDSDWQVWVPKTYAASCKLGQGTSWCTASTENSSYYNEYSSKGNLYININKHNSKEKYQFHFESESFTDADDESIDVIEFVSEYPKLQKFYQKLLPEESQNNFIIKNNVLVEYKEGLFAKKQTEVAIPDGVTSVGDYAFESCHSLTSITIPAGVMSIGKQAFHDCSSLTSITLPEGVTSIGRYAFAYCRSLKSITLRDGLTSIGYGAFLVCERLQSITIPEGVTSIGSEAFYGCSSLNGIWYSGNTSNFRSWYNRVSKNLPDIDIVDNNTGELLKAAGKDISENNKTIYKNYLEEEMFNNSNTKKQFIDEWADNDEGLSIDENGNLHFYAYTNKKAIVKEALDDSYAASQLSNESKECKDGECVDESTEEDLIEIVDEAVDKEVYEYCCLDKAGDIMYSFGSDEEAIDQAKNDPDVASVCIYVNDEPDMCIWERDKDYFEDESDSDADIFAPFQCLNSAGTVIMDWDNEDDALGYANDNLDVDEVRELGNFEDGYRVIWTREHDDVFEDLQKNICPDCGKEIAENGSCDCKKGECKDGKCLNEAEDDDNADSDDAEEVESEEEPEDSFEELKAKVRDALDSCKEEDAEVNDLIDAVLAYFDKKEAINYIRSCICPEEEEAEEKPEEDELEIVDIGRRA